MVTSDIVKKTIDRCDSWFSDSSSKTPIMSRELYPYTSLFSPIMINHTLLSNRIVMAPMGNIAMCDETGRVNEKMMEYFFARAKGGVGLITTGLVPVSHGIDSSITEKGGLSYFPRIDGSRTALMGWRDLVEGIHSFSSRIFIQLSPGLGRVGSPECLIKKFKMPVASSFIPNYYIPEIPSLRLSDGKLKRIVKNMGAAASDAKAMGIDGVYLHGHEGYLLEQMTNRAYNHRKIGRYRDPMRFGIEIVEEIRRRTGERYPIMYRIDLSLALEEVYGEKMERDPILRRFRGGRKTEETLKYMEALVGAGVDLFDVDLGSYDAWWLPHPPSTMPPGAYLAVSRFVKEYFEELNIRSNQGLRIPIVAVGKLGYPDLAESALREGDADMIMLGRPLLSDPDWPKKAFSGRVNEIRPCISCQEGCINEFVEASHPQCAVNPRTAFEHHYPEIPRKAEKRKRIAVIGAGVAGIVFALTASERGHSVTLFERDAEVGGMAKLGVKASFKYEMKNYLDYLKGRLSSSGVILRLNTSVDVKTLKGAYDAAIFATGSKEVEVEIEGIEEAEVITAVDLLRDKRTITEDERVVIIGGGAVGLETALYLMRELGVKDLSVIERLDYFMKGVCTANRGHMLHLLEKVGAKLYNSSEAVKIEDGKLFIKRKTKNIPDPYCTWKPVLPDNIKNPFQKKPVGPEETIALPFDVLITAVGFKSDEDAYYEALKETTSPEVYRIGDAFSPGRVLEATRSAYALGVSI